MSGVLRPNQNRAMTILLFYVKHPLTCIEQRIRGDRGSRWRAPNGNKSLFPKNPNFNYLLLLIIVLFECINIEKKNGSLRHATFFGFYL